MFSGTQFHLQANLYVYECVYVYVYVCLVLCRVLGLLADDPLLFVHLKHVHILKKMLHCISASCFAEGIDLNFFISILCLVGHFIV